MKKLFLKAKLNFSGSLGKRMKPQENSLLMWPEGFPIIINGTHGIFGLDISSIHLNNRVTVKGQTKSK